jgi:CheY-like chemotaxis protein
MPLAFIIRMFGILRAFEALVHDRHDPVEFEEESQPANDKEKQPVCTVLAIDDDPTILQILRPLLREEGFNVLTSTSGPKGLDMLRYAGRDVRIVLLDYNMPQLNGAETLKHLRTLAPQAKVIAVTGVNLNMLPESFSAGVERFIQKPFRTAELIATMREMLGEAARSPAAPKS